MIFIMIIAVLALISTGAKATQYYVSTDGNDLNTGLTWAQAFATVGKGIDTASDGDVIDVNEGEYTGTLDFDEKAITIRSTEPNDWEVVADTEITASAVLFHSSEEANSVLLGCSVDGVIDCDGSGPTIRQCIITGGIYCESGSSAVIENNKITAGVNKGIIIDSSTGQIRNNWIYDSDEGILLSAVTAPVTISNNTITDNANYGIRAVSCTAPNIPNITNCIIWDNDDDLSGCYASYSCIEDTFDVNDANYVGSINTDPCFVDDGNDNFHLDIDSLCINAGDPGGSYYGQTDIDGEQRLYAGILDIGADEVIGFIYNGSKDKFYSYIQDAIDDASEGETLVVYPGSYSAEGPGSNIIDFDGKEITITGSEPDDWEVVEATEITSGVLFTSSEDANSVLIGCTVDNCIDCDGSGPTIQKCIITGGVDCSSGSSAVIENNKITGGATRGILISASSGEIRNNWIYDSTDGIFIANATAEIEVNNNTVVDNSTTGIKVVGTGTDPNIINCILWNNDDDLYGCTATYSCIEDCNDATGVGNICGDGNDPMFTGWMANDGLISYWELDDGSGATAEDSAGSNDGTVTNATWTTGKLDGALDFDGSGDYVSLQSIAALEGNSVTIAAWINGNDFETSGTFNPILTQYDSNDDGYYLYIGEGKPALYMAWNGGSYIEACSPDSINTGQWYHIVGTNDGSTLKIYVNGVLKRSKTSVGFSGVDYDAYIGYDDLYGNCFNGTIDDVAIYDRALLPYEIKRMYQRGLNEHNDYHLSCYSPCVDAGDPNGTYTNQVDIDFNARVIGDGIDMGADERINVYYVDDVNGDDDASGTITSPFKTVVKAITTAEPGDTFYFRQGTYQTVKSATDANIVSIGTTTGALFSTLADENSRITFKSYPGETATITSMKLRNDPNDWTLETGNIYYTDLSVQKLSPEKVSRVSNCSEDGVPLRLMTVHGTNGGPNDLTGPGQWVRDIIDHNLYVWSTDGNNPGTHQTEFSEFIHGGTCTIDILRNPLDDENEADYLTFEDLVIEGGYYPLLVSTDYIEVKNCVIRNCYGDGIKGGGAKPADYNNPDDPNDPNYFNCSYGLIEDCNIYNFGESGIDITGGDYWIVRGNIIHDNVNNRGDLDYLPDTSLYTKANGIMLKNNNKRTIVERNTIYNLDTAYGAIQLGGDSWGGIADEGVDLIVRNNIIYNVSGPYIVIFSTAKNSAFYNNLIYDCNAARGIVEFSLSNSSHSDWDNDDCAIKNNIFYNNVAGPYAGGCNLAYFEHYSGCVSNLTSNYNRVDPNKTYWWGNSNKTLTDWRNLNYDTNSITDTPTFYDVNNYDFYPLDVNSPQVDAGDPNSDANDVGITDFEGNDRFIDGDGDGNDVIDIGPYEYEPNS